MLGDIWQLALRVLKRDVTFYELERHVVCSTSVVSVGFDPEKNVLQVEYFNGCVYEAEDIGPSVYERLKTSARFDRAFKEVVLSKMSLKHVGRVVPVVGA